MKPRSKRYRQGAEKLDPTLSHTFEEAVQILRNFPRAKFDESVEIAIKLGIDPKQPDQAVRGAFSMPHGLGKAARVIAFVDEGRAEEALKAGAVAAGEKSLADKIKNENWFDFDVAIAEPKMMRLVGQLGRLLGPKGLMPSPKAGTVVPDAVKAVSEFVAGKQEYKNDANGNIHLVAGRISFESQKIADNLKAFFQHVQSIRPSGVKGQFIENVSVCTTMGPGLRIAFAK